MYINTFFINGGFEYVRTRKKSPILDKRSSRRTFIKNSGLTVGGLVLGGAIGSLVGGKTETTTHTATGGSTHTAIDYSDTRQFFVRQKILMHLVQQRN